MSNLLDITSKLTDTVDCTLGYVEPNVSLTSSTRYNTKYTIHNTQYTIHVMMDGEIPR